ncbi:hypothetical protein CSC62_07445 [Pseudoxanthomonas jiangsuensis]|uniref:hypothetical protein n=1 Tax=Pseudoxanthomonas jiangsuensis TaxID=619688 RepID=UPI001390FE77|nr:hypothetical protein [Pseudoxanthomonas jiangsuensis]KAF1697972.1 hypothetical protein CSC62_07445 [Pseudoxanthomonas jiangsuensis]
MRSICLAAALAALTACASAPTADQQRVADYGEPIAQAEAVQLAKAFLATRLKDPYSAVYQCGQPTKGYTEAAPLFGQKMQFGYLLDCAINSKNSFGAFTGAKPYQFLIRNGSIVSARGQECLSGGGCYMAPLQ